MAEHTVESNIRPRRVATGAIVLVVGFAAFAVLALVLRGGSSGSGVPAKTAVSKKQAASVVGVFDSFKRANTASSLGAADNGAVWLPIAGTWGIRGDRVYVAHKAPFNNIAITYLGSADGFVQVAASTVEPGCGLVVRFHDRLNYVAVLAVPKYASWLVEEVVGGKATVIGNVGLAPVRNGTLVAVRLSGATAEVSIDNRPAKSFAIHQVAGAGGVGLIGTGAQASDARWKDFVATPQAVAVPTTTTASTAGK